MSSKRSWTRFQIVWGVTAPLIPFFIFLLLDLFDLSLNLKLLITIISAIVWAIILIPFVVMDWDERRRERIKEACKSDAMLNLFQCIIDIRDDGSSLVKRKIKGINYAEIREYYELEAWTDPEIDPQIAEQIREQRTIVASATVVRSGHNEEICRSREFPPNRAHRVNRVIHLIPVSRSGNLLAPNDEFEIDLEEETEKGTWRIGGDYYLRRVRHVTQKMHIEILLPRSWRFPSRISATERIVIGEVKDPSCGEWNRTNKQPERKSSRGRTKLVWEIDYPKLFHVYRITYHAMERIEQD